MIDTLNGQLRVRKWPRAKGGQRSKAQRKQEEWFAQVQRAANYVAPNMMWQFHEATQGTPLLPRDILTHILSGRAFMFVTPSGRKMYPMIFRNSVEEALDAITQTIGDTLIRTENGWRGQQGGSGGGDWWFDPPLADQFTVSSSTPILPLLTDDSQAGLLIDWQQSGTESLSRAADYVNALPATDSQVTAVFRHGGGQNMTGGCGIRLLDPISGRNLRLRVTQDNPDRFRVMRYTDLNTYDGDYYNQVARMPTHPAFVRMALIGSRVQTFVSPNAKQWLLLHDVAISAWFPNRPTVCGVFGYVNSGTNVDANLLTSIERFEVSAPDAA